MRLLVALMVGLFASVMPANGQDLEVAAIRLGVVDFDASIEFYTEHMECTVVADAREAGFVVLDLAGVPIVLTGADRPVVIDPARPNVRVNFNVNDFERRVERLRAAGVRFVTGEVERSAVGRYIAMRDPSGNAVNLKELFDESKRPESVKVYNVGVSVPDMDEALAFYRDTLGIKVMTEDYYPPVMVMEPGGVGYFILHESVKGRAPYGEGTAWTGMAFEVGNIESAMTELEAKGVRFIEDAPVRSGPVYTLHTHDPFGNIVEFIEHVQPVSEGQVEVPSSEAASIDELGWLTGTWVWDSPQGPWVEIWGPPTGGAIAGFMHATRDGESWLYELFTVQELDGQIRYSLRHFEAGLVPWATEADGPLTMPLLEASTNKVVFEDLSREWPQRLIYTREGENLVARLEGDASDGPRVFELRFGRAGS